MPFSDVRIGGAIEHAAQQGAMSAAQSLSLFVGRPVSFVHRHTRLLMHVGEEHIINVDDDHDRVLVGTIDIAGTQFSGRGFVVMGHAAVDDLLRIFALDLDDTGQLTELGTSMLAEFTNITMSSYLNSISDVLNMAVDPSPTTLHWHSHPLVASELDVNDPAIVLHCECSADSAVTELALMILIRKADIAAITRGADDQHQNVSSMTHEG